MRTLVIRGLYVQVDAYKNDPVAEARGVLAAINGYIVKLSGDPLLDFDLGGSADLQAEYTGTDEEEEV